MKRNVRFSILMLAMLLCLGCFAACKGNGDNGKDTTPGTGGLSNSTQAPGSTDPDEIPEYVYPDLDMDGENIRFRGLSWLWDMYIFLDADNTGNKLDKEIYNRNNAIENKFNCNIVVDEFSWNWSMDEYINNIQNALLNNMDAWDVVYIPVNKRPDMITMGYFQDLKQFSGLQLDQPWWDAELNDTFELADRLYFASSPLQLQAFDSAWAIFFNQTLITQRDMTDPRQLVADNAWTLETLDEMAELGADKGSADTFYYDNGEGNQIYGISAHPNLPDKLLFAMGERYVSKNNDGIPEFTGKGDLFVTKIKSLADLLGAQSDHNLHASSNDMVAFDETYYGKTGGYVYVFTESRALFMGAEVKTSRVIKNYDSDVSYGIVPLPKADSSQKEWYTPVVETLLTMTIPNTCRKTETVSKVVDAMAYMSHTEVLPVYYDQLLYGGYTAEDEPIMEILRSSRGVDMAYYYAWNSDLANEIQERIFDGTGEISSSLQNAEEAIATKITNWLESISTLQNSSGSN